MEEITNIENNIPIPEGQSQADFMKNDLGFNIDTNDPLTKAALSDSVENENMDILGSGELIKKTLIKGEKNTRPGRLDLCVVDIIGKLDNGTEVENFVDYKIQLGDVEVVQGLDLAIALMDVGEVAEITVFPRFAYGKLGRDPDIPPSSKIIYKVVLKTVTMEPEIDEMNYEKRKEFADKKRERGNWWFFRDEPVLAIQCYRRCLDYLQFSVDDSNKTAGNKMTDTQLQALFADRTKVFNNLAAAQIKTEAYDTALESVDNVLRAEPENIKALFRKGRILKKKCETKKAILTLEKAVKLDPESKVIAQELSVLRQKLVDESAEQKKLYRKMLGSSNENKYVSLTPTSKFKRKFAVWSLVGGTLAAVASLIVYRFVFYFSASNL